MLEVKIANLVSKHKPDFKKYLAEIVKQTNEAAQKENLDVVWNVKKSLAGQLGISKLIKKKGIHKKNTR